MKISAANVDGFRQALLSWYDGHRRALPWRAGRGLTPDPYHVWLSEIMLQQTVVAAVIPYFQKFVEKWPTIHELAAANQNDVMESWAGLGYYARARNLYKCAGVVSQDLKGCFPAEQVELKKLPGIGDYTSAAIMSIAFDKPATVVDGNVERVISRYFAITEPLPDSKPIIRRYAAALSEGRIDRPGDFAQGMMDLGATICTPKSPGCGQCPLKKGCQGYELDIQSELPKRRAKKDKPQKYGYIYWVSNEKGQVLFERRPESGMLGGMLGLPTSTWEADKKDLKHEGVFTKAGFNANKALKIYHSFTHFDLELSGQHADIKDKKSFSGVEWQWIDTKELEKLGLPTLFKKFVRLMLQNNT